MAISNISGTTSQSFHISRRGAGIYQTSEVPDNPEPGALWLDSESNSWYVYDSGESAWLSILAGPIGLSDIEQSGAEVNQVASWSGSQWVPSLPKHRWITVDSEGQASTSTLDIGHYVRTISTSSSSLTIHVTDNSQSNGEKIFNDLSNCAINVIVLRNTTSNNESPWAHLRSVSEKSFDIQIKRSNTGGILIGGSYAGNDNNSNTVSLRIYIAGLLAE